MKVPISITVEESTVKKVDTIRGMVPRSRILEKAIDVGLEYMVVSACTVSVGGSKP